MSNHPTQASLRGAARARALATVLAAVAISACAGNSAAPATSPAADTGPVTLRLGYLPNLTHAPALVGLQAGYFRNSLGSDVTLETHTFNAGPDEVTALLSGALDAAFMGPNPTTNAFVQSHGRAVRVVSGATSGGALLVVRPGITSAADLKGRKIADPQLGGTQDTALRWYLKSKGLKTDTSGGGDVSVVPQDNSQSLLSYRQGSIDGGWLPEPYASRMVIESGAHVLVDERDLWPQGSFVTTDLVVRTDFLRAHPARIKALLEGLYQAVEAINADPTAAQGISNQALTALSGKPLAGSVLTAAWGHMTFTVDPLASSLATAAGHAHDLDLLPRVDLKGLYDLGLLNQVLAEHHKAAVKGL